MPTRRKFLTADGAALRQFMDARKRKGYVSPYSEADVIAHVNALRVISSHDD
jgi:hypothetical protein